MAPEPEAVAVPGAADAAPDPVAVTPPEAAVPVACVAVVVPAEMALLEPEENPDPCTVEAELEVAMLAPG